MEENIETIDTIETQQPTAQTQQQPLIKSDAIISYNPSIEKMDSLVMKLQEYTKINVSSMINNTNTQNNNSNSNSNNSNSNNNNNSNNSKNKIIKDETPEYYANEHLKFLSDTCNEKDKRIKIVNNILNVSIIANVILISYILGTYFYQH